MAEAEAKSIVTSRSLAGAQRVCITAFRLGPRLGNKVCLFEKENRLGGRIYAVPKDENDPNSPVFGLSALRIMETQDVVFALARELGIQYETVPFQNDLMIARGTSAQDSDTLRSLAYPLVDAGEVDLYNKLTTGHVASHDRFPALKTLNQ